MVWIDGKLSLPTDRTQKRPSKKKTVLSNEVSQIQVRSDCSRSEWSEYQTKVSGISCLQENSVAELKFIRSS
jgi:hypothetical protein